MRFSYYARLGKKDKAIYDRSDAIASIRLPQPSRLWPLIPMLQAALAGDDKRAVQAASTMLARGVTDMLKIEPVEVHVLAVRPTLSSAELHGLYTRDALRTAKIRVWMRTVRHRRVVAFKTFLRTLLHELCHHLDYTHLKLAESFHTEGFFKRESSLFHQLVTDAAEGEGGRGPARERGGERG